MKILVRSPNWIGDQILAYPFFHFLRRAYPRARIVVSCTAWTESVQFENLIDDIVVLPKPRHFNSPPTFLAKAQALELAAKELKKAGPFEIAITLPNSFSSAWILYRSGAKSRIGYAADGRSFLLTEPKPWNPEKIGHRSNAYVELLPEAAKPPRKFSVTDFWGVPSESEDEELDPGIPSLVSFRPEVAWASTTPLMPPLEGGYWVMAPGSTAETRRWPLENFANLARKISQETGLPGLVVGGVAEAPLAQRLCEDAELGLRDFTAQGSVAALWPVFKNARFTLSNDSGLAHVAALCGSQVQIVWGAGDPKRTEPLGPGRVRVLFNPVDCWPCERNTCSQEAALKLSCIRGMDSNQVWEEMKRGLRL
jgi:heptosyltransferase-2